MDSDHVWVIRDRFADLCHRQWAHWMKYIFSKCPRSIPDGSVVIPKALADRWEIQIHTSFAQLSQGEQDSDRLEADKFIALSKGVLDEQEAMWSARVSQLQSQIEPLAGLLLREMDGPKQNESACEMAARLLCEQRLEISDWKNKWSLARGTVEALEKKIIDFKDELIDMHEERRGLIKQVAAMLLRAQEAEKGWHEALKRLGDCVSQKVVSPSQEANGEIEYIGEPRDSALRKADPLGP